MRKLAKVLGVILGVIVGMALLAAAGLALYFALATHEPEKILPLDGLPERLAAEVPELQRIYAVPGVAVGIVTEGRVWKTWNFGFADRERGIAVDDDTVFGV